jgi:hypothetical protein
LVALTFKVDEPPAEMETGLGVMATVGAAAGSDCAVITCPHPATISKSGSKKIAAKGGETLWNLCGRIFIACFRSLVDGIESNKGRKQEKEIQGLRSLWERMTSCLPARAGT